MYSETIVSKTLMFGFHKYSRVSEVESSSEEDFEAEGDLRTPVDPSSKVSEVAFLIGTAGTIIIVMVLLIHFLVTSTEKRFDATASTGPNPAQNRASESINNRIR